MKNTPGEALRTYFNGTVFTFEIIGVFLLVFFVFTFKLLSIILKKQNNKLFLSVCFTMSTALAFFLPYAFASIISKTAIAPFLNPMIVLFKSILIGFGKSGQDLTGLTGSMLTKGIPYIFAGQLIGGILGFVAFLGFFYAIKRTYANKVDYELLQQTTIKSFFQTKSELSTLGFSIKEFIFITSLIIVMPLISMIDHGIYRIDMFGILLIELFVIWVILFISSFLEYFSFHLFFPILDIVFKTVNFALLDKEVKKQELKGFLTELLKLLLVVIFSITIPIVIGFICILIKMQTGVVISLA
ncbi:MAG4940 family membrane protein [Mycoplasma cottewii]|uniref:MAG4940 family membrane protein n=1 Tax=Mycoplasma cottewii TaxID=51364 RepID=UPI0035C69EF4